MNKKDDSASHLITELELFLKEPIDITIDKGSRPRLPPTYSQQYHDFLNARIWGDCDYSVDDMMNGEEIINVNHHTLHACASLKNRVHACLDSDESMMIQMVEDCGHRLDHLESGIKAHILTNKLTSSEYMQVKRSSEVIHDIFIIIKSRIEQDDNLDHRLQARTKANLKKILEMNFIVDKHLDDMLASVDRGNLKADSSAWLVIATVIGFAMMYSVSFFALDKEKTALEHISYFFGIR